MPPFTSGGSGDPEAVDTSAKVGIGGPNYPLGPSFEFLSALRASKEGTMKTTPLEDRILLWLFYCPRAPSTKELCRILDEPTEQVIAALQNLQAMNLIGSGVSSASVNSATAGGSYSLTSMTLFRHW